jgi:hypothetical protein
MILIIGVWETGRGRSPSQLSGRSTSPLVSVLIVAKAQQLLGVIRQMTLRKTSLSLLALAAALAFWSSPALQAAPLLGPGTKVQPDKMIEQAQATTAGKADDPEDANGAAAPAKKGAKAKKKAKQDGPAPAKKAAAKAGRCGTYMYWDRKAKACTDARDKK